MRKTVLSILAVCAMTFGLNAQIQNYTVGQTVADFTVTDVHGNTHTLSSITGSGQWVLLDFFFVACGPCQATVPYFSELHEKYGCNEGDLFCISIDSGDSDADVLSFESTYSESSGHSPAPAASGTDGGGDAVVSAFGPAAYPTFCLVGPDMTLRNADIWPVGSVADFESAMSAAGFTPTEMQCSGGGSAGIEEAVSFNEFSVYPNPAVDNATIAVNLDANSDVAIEVYNMVGAVVATESFNGVAGENKFELNTSNIENGQYILKVSFGNDAHTQVSLNVMK